MALRAATRLDSDLVLDAVAAYYGLWRAELGGRSRARRVSDPRQVAMYLLVRAGYTYTAIGGLLGRDHTTVIHGQRATARRLVYDKDLQVDVAEITAAVRGTRVPHRPAVEGTAALVSEGGYQ